MLSSSQRRFGALAAVGGVLATAACRAPRVDVFHPAIAVEASVRLAADVILPATRPNGGIPTVLIQTRYWRAFRMRGGGGPRIPQGPREGIVERLVAAGFAVVVTDVRGTGASDGIWRWPWSDEEVRDMGPVIDWIVAQPWSNGTVGATGVSYEGTTALLAATAGRPALRAILARQIEWQLVDETIAPGGVRNALFADLWGRTVDDLDHGRYPAMFPGYAKWFVTGVGRRDDDPKGVAQRAREAARPTSAVAARARNVTRGADRFGSDAPATDSLGPAGRVPALSRTGAVVAIWGSWWDGATADAVFRAQDAMRVAEAVIGPWTHEGDEHASPLQRKNGAAGTVSLDSVVAFFTRHLLATPGAIDSSRVVRWYVAGAEEWRSATQWPRTQPLTWTVDARSDDSLRQWTATGTASTGTNNRWTSGLARPVDVTDRANARGVHALRLVPPAESFAPLTIFGAGTFTCRMHADQSAATLHVYVEAVDARGRARLLSEGMQHVARVSSTDTMPPFVSVRIRPVAFALPTGWRLRMTLAGEDRPTFARVPSAAPVRWSFDPRRCALTLPVELTADTSRVR